MAHRRHRTPKQIVTFANAIWALACSADSVTPLSREEYYALDARVHRDLDVGCEPWEGSYQYCPKVVVLSERVVLRAFPHLIDRFPIGVPGLWMRSLELVITNYIKFVYSSRSPHRLPKRMQQIIEELQL